MVFPLGMMTLVPFGVGCTLITGMLVCIKFSKQCVVAPVSAIGCLLCITLLITLTLGLSHFLDSYNTSAPPFFVFEGGGFIMFIVATGARFAVMC